MMMIPKSGRRGFANCMVSRPSLDRVLNRLCSLEPADGQVGDNFRCTTFKKINAGEAVKISLPLSRLGRVTQFVGFALVMSLALLALAAATKMLAWDWRYISVQVRRVFAIFATNASFLHITKLLIKFSMICNTYHVKGHFLPNKHCI